MPRLKYEPPALSGANEALQQAIVQAALQPDQFQTALVVELRKHPGVLETVLDQRAAMLSGAEPAGMGGLFDSIGKFFEKAYKGATGILKDAGPVIGPAVSVFNPIAGAIVTGASAVANAASGSGQLNPAAYGYGGMGPPNPYAAGGMGPPSPYIMGLPGYQLPIPNMPWLNIPMPGAAPAVAAPAAPAATASGGGGGGIDKNLLLLIGAGALLFLLK